MSHDVTDDTVVASGVGSLLKVLLAVAAAIVVANQILTLSLGPAPASLGRAEVLDPDEYQRVGGQIAGAERDLSDPRTPDNRPLAVVLGLSTAREDIDAASLGQQLCPRMRVLNLGSSGSSYRELAFYLRTLPKAKLHSGLTLLAVHPAWLAERPRVAGLVPDGGGISVDGPRSRAIVTAVREIGHRWGWGWLSGNRRGMHATFRNALASIRARIADGFGLPMSARFPDRAAAPWAPRIAYHELHASPAFMAQQLQAWQVYGWFDPANYAASGPEAASMRQLVTESRALGSHVVIVLLPEQSGMRQRVPPAADVAFHQALAETANAAVIDLRARLPDDMFYDYVHLNAVGRSRATTLVSQLVTMTGCSN